MQMVGRLNVEAAKISRAASGATVFDDPDCPWVVRLWTHTPDGGPPIVSSLTVTARTGQRGIKAAQLGRLPLTSMLHLATTDPVAVRYHENEMYYRKLARPMAPGQRSWTDDHWDTVLLIYDWANATGRPGGGIQAIADMWGVAKKPTAERWRAKARRRRDATS